MKAKFWGVMLLVGMMAVFTKPANASADGKYEELLRWVHVEMAKENPDLGWGQTGGFTYQYKKYSEGNRGVCVCVFFYTICSDAS